MKHRYLTLVLLTSLLLLAPSAHAATGFVSSPLLLSPEAPKDGDQVTLSVLFHNDESAPISGTVLFYDGETLLAKRSLHIASGDVGISSTTFDISSGIHKFSATINDVGDGIILPTTTVTLPAKLVTKKIGLGAQASGEGASSESAILNKVTEAQDAVLGVVPEGAKTAVSNTVTTIDNWRENTADSLIEHRDDVKTSIEAGKKIDAANAARKPGTKEIEKPATADNGVATEAKYIFLGALAWFFDMPFAFYLGAIVLFYLLVRFIIRRIRAYRANR